MKKHQTDRTDLTVRIADLEKMVDQMEELARSFQNGMNGYQSRVCYFNNMRWFRRVWHVICGGRV